MLQVLMPVSMSRSIASASTSLRVGLVLLAAAVGATSYPATLTSAQTAPPPTYTSSEESPEDFPPGPGRDEAFYGCVACHNFKLVAAQGLSRDRWDETITLMIVRHNMPAVEGADRKLILDYLAAAFPERPTQRRGWQNPFQQ